jgi:hypothetical protein
MTALWMMLVLHYSAGRLVLGSHNYSMMPAWQKRLLSLHACFYDHFALIEDRLSRQPLPF